MIWVKRLAPFVIITAAIFIYLHYTGKQAAQRAELENHYALATAKIWAASAMLRDKPEEYARVRDSLLDVYSLTEDELLEFLSRRKDEAEELYPYARLVQEHLDSLMDIQDSLWRQRRDSIETADTVTRSP